jgi:pimeloyl-ACP methyl ester carboxylesterase
MEILTMLLRAALLICLLGLAACGGSAGSPAEETPITPLPITPQAILPSPGKPGTFQPAACPFVLPQDVRQGEEVDCGYLTVEEQRSTAQGTNSRHIQLAVAVFHPPGGARHPDPLIHLSGGPGASALEAIRYQYEWLSTPAFSTGRDLIVFDQRGVGVSRPALDCPGYDRLALNLLNRNQENQSIDEDEISALILDELSSCRDALAEVADLSAYNSAASAADVNDLRLALGYHQVNLWGGSYGTRLALEVMRRYPSGLRSVVLDSVYPPDVDLYAEAPANFSRALERLFSACAANSVCDQAYPNLRKVFFDTVQRLDAQPVLREIQNPVSGKKHEAWMDGETLMGLTFQLLYDSKMRFLLPGQIFAASRRDYTAFDRVRGALIGQLGLSSRGMMFSVQCNEELPFSSLESLEQEQGRHPEISAFYENALLGKLTYQVCEQWGAGQAEASANQPVHSDIATLVMSGEFDPITPPAWGRHAAESLGKAFFYEYPGLGHGTSVVDDCPRGMMIAFLTDPTAPPENACISEMIYK